MKKSKLYIWLTISLLFLANYNLSGQEIKVHNLPKDSDFSSFEPKLFKQGEDEKLYIAVVFARIANDYFFLNDDQVLKFDQNWIDNITLVKSSDLLTAINYEGPYRVVVYNIKKSNREELFKEYLKN